ncbi:ribosome maturation factor RimM [Ekhidna sp.]|uniref:ribosome maturation factor RimM n=1 Tax=Ekhidna sp. TaxID=2608089 RepID=UPI003CCC0F3D
MRQDDCYQLGEVIKTHGLNGEVSILLDVDFPNEYQNLESVFLEQSGKLVPFFIDTIQVNGNKALVQFEDIESLDEAKALVKSKLYLPLSTLPDLEEGKYYYHELVGCEVFEDKQPIGTVINVIDLNGNQLLSVDASGKEVLIPLKDEILLSADIKKKKLTVKLPEGLLDMYLEEDSDTPED